MSSDARVPIVIERLIGAPIADVFDAWGDAKSLSVWMCPAEAITGATVDCDFRVGGRYRIVMHGDEGDYAQHGEYLEIETQKRIVFTWVTEWAPDDEVSETRVTVSMEAESADATRLRLVHEDLTIFYDNHEGGWGRIVSELDHHILRGRAR